MSTVIRTTHLTRSFGDLVAVNKLTLEIERGEVFGFLGHNGAGKTTTVRLINGVLSPSDGAVRVFDMDPTTDGAKIRARTGVLTETPALDDRLTARDTLQYFGEMFGVPVRQLPKRIDALLEMFDLDERANDKVGGFSKGMRQRLALARTIIHDPEIVFLDEPTSGLDPLATREVRLMIQRLRQENRTVFLATHNLNEAERLCDRVAVLAKGSVLALGTTRELAADLDQGHRLRVEVDAPMQARAASLIRTLQHVNQVEEEGEPNGEAHSNGNAFLSVHGAGREMAPLIVAELVHAGISVYRLEPEEASLEDVYFALEHE